MMLPIQIKLIVCTYRFIFNPLIKSRSFDEVNRTLAYIDI